MASTSRRQSSFTETRGKRQQFDVECISSDDDDDTVNVGTGAAFHVWHRPTEPARSPVPCTVSVAEPVFGIQEGGPTVTHHSSDDDDADDDPGVGQCRPVDVNVPVCKERDVLTVDAAKVRRVRRAVINGRAVESRSFKDEQMESKKSQGAPGVLFQSQETCGSLRSRARRA